MYSIPTKGSTMTGTNVSKWLQSGLVPLEVSATSLLSMLTNPVRIEEHTDGKTYTLRAEVPGVDAEKDVTVTYFDGALRLQIRRADARKDKTHTEFNYGSYDRTVPMAVGVDEHTLKASYADGILEIHAKVTDTQDTHRTIPVAVGPRAEHAKTAKH
jgi:HSP20 family protein